MSGQTTVLDFIKMHGLGNDFVVFDARTSPLDLTPAQARFVGSRRFGIGCDQILTIQPSDKADAFMRIQNPDGSEAGACGNGTRCVASYLMRDLDKNDVVIETVAGLLHCALEAEQEELISVDMGAPRLDWQAIPTAAEVDTLHAGLAVGPLKDPVLVNMGNPHAVFFVDDVDDIDLEALGPQVEHHAMFPERTNVEIAQIRSRGDIRLRVWERGAGVTMACGSGACATAVAAIRRGLTDREVMIELDGGPLELDWAEGGSVVMRGPVATSFWGRVAL
ncbi:MAG: diaminopimelate epimerase [Alphaproteobacteria bacterium]